MGFKSPPPDNKFYHFKKGEELVWYREGGSERGAIRYSDGHEVDLDQWINSYDVSQELDQTPKHKEISDRIGSVARDISFATMYFMEAPKGMAEAIAEIIISDADKGELVIAVDEKGYTDKDKKKLAAYRVIARNLGFAVGKFHKEGGFATAVIRPRDS